ncbi:class I SAM-dependent methyltransferase [Clostridium perfringens]|uniref:class I SAM-dependent methyltransferase n=1 Tax=Clostridium perfringens TaxID=1502 RepID=UPI0013E3E722|nr:class I SAM-dependent methyltransferase [Clostridium perfringens]NGT57791.1 class I SAM-dependent methyltransferase [Clostridium perfringens]NGT96562.1 class I SAM-dependent methyltransferase [Clostridium perfringens]
MDKRFTFNEDAMNYEKWRPTYCEELFYDIMEYSKLDRNKKTLEIGIGTGQATLPFLKTECDLIAIELGENLAEFSKNKFKAYKNFNILNIPFEDFKCDENTFDLIYSATAFHWIDENIGYPKALKLLKPGGTLALFWNKPFIGRKDDLLHQKIQSIYEKYKPSKAKPIENDKENYKELLEKLRKYGFKDVELKLYHKTRAFNACDYISLLNTYSDHRTMNLAIKTKFEEEIKKAILEHNNLIKVYNTMELYLARKKVLGLSF